MAQHHSIPSSPDYLVRTWGSGLIHQGRQCNSLSDAKLGQTGTMTEAEPRVTAGGLGCAAPSDLDNKAPPHSRHVPSVRMVCNNGQSVTTKTGEGSEKGGQVNQSGRPGRDRPRCAGGYTTTATTSQKTTRQGSEKEKEENRTKKGLRRRGACGQARQATTTRPTCRRSCVVRCVSPLPQPSSAWADASIKERLRRRPGGAAPRGCRKAPRPGNPCRGGR